MADTTLELNAGSGGSTLAVDDIAGAIYQYVGLAYGGSGSKTAVSNSNPMPTKITDGTDTALVTAAGELSVSLITALPAGANAIGKLAANSGVDIGDVDVTSFPSTVHSADFDSGGGTDTTLAFGIAVPASGGAAVVPGDATAGLKVNLGADNDVTVTGTVAVTQSGTWDEVGINDSGNSITVDDGGTTLSIDDGAGSITVDGTVAVTNAGLTELAAAINASSQMDVNIAASSATVAVSNAGITTIAGAVSGSEMQVDVVGALPAGNNVVGQFKITDGTDVADVLDLISSNPLTVAIVDGNGDQITSFGGGTQYTEDAAAAANPVGNALIVVREDGRAGSLTTTDGDNVALRGNNFGELYVKHTDSIAVTDGGGALSIDDGGNTITVDGTVAVTSAGITTIAGAVSGTEMQVDVVAALPAGNNVIGQVKLTDGTDVADVLDLTSSNPLAVAIVDTNGDQISSFGGGTEYTVDNAAPANPVGATFVMERDDQLSTVAEAAGDWTNARATAKGALWVALADSAGDPITSFGGGTQYTEADTDASITGTAILWEDTSDTLRAVSAAKPLPVAIISAVSPVGATNVATGQAAPTNSAATLVASRATRTRLTLVNRGSVSVYVGPATVTTANGVELKPGESMTFEVAGTTLQGITASGTGNIHYWEEYN